MAYFVWLLTTTIACVLFLNFQTTIADGGGHEALRSSSPPLFIFGDSTVDSGNNNFIETIPENKANFEPYGLNGFFQEPTGRFSDGRITVDYIAEYAKLPLIPPYNKPSAEYIHGVNFASGGAGVLSSTNQGLVIDLKTQLKNFEEVYKSLTQKLGSKEATNEMISDAVYYISIGSNDYMGGYLGNPTMQQLHPPQEFVTLVISNLTFAIQELYEKGARKFAFLSLSALGCVPALRAANPKADGGCFEEASALALAHNYAFSALLSNLETLLEGFKYVYSDYFYNWLNDRVNNPTHYGFKEGVNACCGTGPYGGIFTCGGNKAVSEYQLCENVSDYVFFDSFHATEKVHQQLAEVMWEGTIFSLAASPSVAIGPRSYNLKDLFFEKEKITIADVVDIDSGYQII
ncbi:lipase [Lithospermum erythrorhizon]|uniref:Lipase n=1 Tax=Lithospermum erythrorhizon TaxID=34254 RepID=A0AAV3R8J1_LITER